MHIYYACFERLTNEFQIISKNSGQSTCEVRYEVIAEVFQKPNSIFHSNPSVREELAVAAASSVSPGLDTSLLLPAEMFPINACCCFSCSRPYFASMAHFANRFFIKASQKLSTEMTLGIKANITESERVVNDGDRAILREEAD